MRKIHRDHWPVIFLFSCFGFLGLLFVGSALSDANALCGPDERINPAICARNWVNAAGNLVAVIGAFLAAAFAYRQYREARRQTAIAHLPMAEATLLIARQIHGTLVGATIALKSMRDAVEAILEELSLEEPDLDRILIAVRHYSSMGLQIAPHIKAFQDTFAEKVLDNALNAAIRPNWFEFNVVLLEMEERSTQVRALAEDTGSVEEGDINFDAFHELVADRENLEGLIAALNEGMRLSKTMADSISVLKPSFEAARDSLLDVIGRS
ncbi:hypothetical protein [Microvirga thermotolerans]|uniref:Uncharacterized protein n=1 Tax=Microvirga thermotolerans TaxID=2651334 RepID=A0A5P9JTW9_9HYPH|nr:hypothetical protein [Microvirga thermotolerans]QFU15218.1 hypothetical protein GDR74_02730 [Microvirga thermotolerans]